MHFQLEITVPISGSTALVMRADISKPVDSVNAQRNALGEARRRHPNCAINTTLFKDGIARQRLKEQKVKNARPPLSATQSA